MSERARTLDGGAASQADMTAAEFAQSTPSVRADRIECQTCGEEYIGDARREQTLCPSCAIDDPDAEYPPTGLPEGDA